MVDDEQDVVAFIQKQEPFSHLPLTACRYFSRHLDFIYLALENQNDYLNSAEPNLYLVRSGTFDLTTSQGETIIRLIEGDFFGFSTLLSGDKLNERLQVVNPGLVYFLCQQDFDYLRREYIEFEQYFVRAHTHRLINLHYLAENRNWSEYKVCEVMSRQVITSNARVSISEAAEVMSRHGISSLVLTDKQKLLGLITDKDLREHVLAVGLDPNLPIKTIMTENPRFIFENNRVFSALNLMLKHNIHHLPVLDETYTLKGIITSTDLLTLQKSDPLQLIRKIYRARTEIEMKYYAGEIPELLRQFSNRIKDTSVIENILSEVIDALTSRLIQLYQREYGAAPCGFCWVCFGAQATEEQPFQLNQCNGLLIEETVTDEQLNYFVRLGRYVCEHLVECGIKRCSGDIMASNENGRGTVTQWHDRFYTWIKLATPKALINCKICFDLRFVNGSASLFQNLLSQLAQLCKNDLLYTAMVNDINKNSVPIGFFNQFIFEKGHGEHKYLDLKSRGILIINDLVRLYALKAGILKANTLERLDALLKFNVLSQREILDLRDCWRYLTELRLKTQIDQNGLLSNCIDPQTLATLQKYKLKKTFALIKQAQHTSAFKLTKKSV
jgi:CBS domain-containing protein